MSADPSQPPIPPEPPARAVTWRSVTLGFIGVVIICGLTPYNDYALNNTFLVGNNLPLGVVMLLFLFTLLINGPISKFKPSWAFTTGEISVAFAMTLISCGLPSSGLMRYFPPSLVSPYWHAQQNAEYLNLLDSLNLPRWIFPDFKGDGPREWISDPIVYGYLGRWTHTGPMPLLAWVTPALTWGIFLLALYGAMLCMIAILRKQWFENERLSFPLAEIQLSLIEQPVPGKFLNTTLRSRVFWIAFGGVFLLHAWNGGHQYWPEHLPRIPVYYNFHDLFTEEPWFYVDSKIKDAAVFFTVVGVAYFIPGPVAFSLWAFYVLNQFYRMLLGTWTGDAIVYGQQDQHFGGIIAFTIAVLWVGRRHWKLVFAQMLRGEREGEDRGRYMSYRFASIGLISCIFVMINWLWLAGTTVVGAIVAVLLLLTLFFVITRIIAETGLVHGQLQVGLYKPWQFITEIGWSARPVPMETFYLTSMLQSVHYDYREVVAVYGSHGTKVSETTVFHDRTSEDDTPRHRRVGRQVMLLMLIALIVGYFVSFTSTLATEYTYAWTKDVSGKMPINEWGAEQNSRGMMLYATQQYQRGDYYPRHSVVGNITFGFILTGALSVLRWRYAWWPFHPIGYLMLGTFPSAHLWFSIFLGWVCKAVIVRFGGSKFYVQAKPFFLGLIVGESIAAGFWLVAGIIMSLTGYDYRPINIMPG